MPLKPCLDCRALSSGTRCPMHRASHERQRDQARGSRQARGYDAEHERVRTYWQQRLDQGERISCRSLHCTCGHQPVDPRDWHLGHTDDRLAWTGPESSTCNLSAAGKAAHR